VPHLVSRLLDGSRRFVLPRPILALLALAYVAIGVGTLRGPNPDFIRHPTVWACLSLLGAAACVAALLNPVRLAVSTAGTITIVIAAARSFATGIEAVAPAGPRPVTSYLVQTAAWAMIALLSWAVFATLILPWAASSHLDRVDRLPDEGEDG
jgi:hypothetical protein